MPVVCEEDTSNDMRSREHGGSRERFVLEGGVGAQEAQTCAFDLEVVVHQPEHTHGEKPSHDETPTRVPKAPPASSEATRRSMQGNRSKNTKPELLVRRYLREVGLQGYRVQWKVGKGLGKPDIAFPGRRVAVFVHGCFWHRCPYCHPSEPRSNVEFWEAKFKRNQERDKRDQEALLAAGWTVIVVWECRLKKKRLKRTMEEIVAEVRLTEPVRTKADERPGKLIVLGLTHVRGPRGLAVRRVRGRKGAAW